MHCLAENFANQLRQEIEKSNLQESFGPTVKYGNIYLGKSKETFVQTRGLSNLEVKHVDKLAIIGALLKAVKTGCVCTMQGRPF